VIDEIERALAAIDSKYWTTEKLRYERMIQFELYHQIRRQNANEVELTPEYKKESRYFAQNPFSEKIGTYIPDFLIHSVGDKSNQNVAIEIKDLNTNDMGKIHKDIKKLMCYCHNSVHSLNYRIGILILYGDDFIPKLKRAKKYKDEIIGLFNYAYNPVEIWHIGTDKTIKRYKKEDMQRLGST